MKNKISQYPDLLKYQRKGIFVPFILTGVFCAVLIGIAVYLFANNLVIHHSVFYIILCLVILLPIFVFKPFSSFLDKSYKGKIVDVECVEENAKSTYIGSTSTLLSIYSKDVLHIKVLTEKNKEIAFTVSNDYLEDSGAYQVTRQWYKDAHIKCALAGYYNKGDEIEHIKGFAFNRKLNLKPDEKNLCIVCGTLNIPKDDHCHNCGYSIIK